jgi:hypothetical protein
MVATGQLASRRHNSRARSCGHACLGLAALLCLSGCMVPSYHLPAGFSSSYQRQLYGMEPVPPDPSAQGLTALETHAGIFYPTTALHEAPFSTQQVTEAKKIEPMHLPPEPTKPSPPLPAIVISSS